jgi:hypothetical protein
LAEAKDEAQEEALRGKNVAAHCMSMHPFLFHEKVPEESLQVQALDLDYYDPDQCNEDINDKDFSIVSDIEDKMDANVIIEHKADTNEIEKDYLSNFDLTNFEGKKLDYVKELLEIFSHCFKLNDNEHTIMRDLRISLRIPLIEGKKNEC